MTFQMILNNGCLKSEQKKRNSFISLPFCPDPDPDRAKKCGSVRIRIRNPAIYIHQWNANATAAESSGVLLPAPLPKLHKNTVISINEDIFSYSLGSITQDSWQQDFQWRYSYSAAAARRSAWSIIPDSNHFSKYDFYLEEQVANEMFYALVIFLPVCACEHVRVWRVWDDEIYISF